MEDITLGELARNMKTFTEQNSEEHKTILSFMKDSECRITKIEKAIIQIKPVLWALSAITAGVAIPLLYKFFEVKIFDK